MVVSATANKAVTLCESYTGGSETDWYLPSSWELNLLYNAAFVISEKLANDGLSATNPLHPGNVSPTFGNYWSSTEFDDTTAWGYSFFYGYSSNYTKTKTNSVRAVRTF